MTFVYICPCCGRDLTPSIRLTIREPVYSYACPTCGWKSEPEQKKKVRIPYPSYAKDGSPIVRCCDCVYYRAEYAYKRKCLLHHTEDILDDDYCSKAIKKGTEQVDVDDWKACEDCSSALAVRCVACKFWDRDAGGGHYGYCHLDGYVGARTIDENGFCCFGELRGNN